MGLTEISNHSRTIISYLKSYSCVQIVRIRQGYLINRIAYTKKKYLNPFNCAQADE